MDLRKIINMKERWFELAQDRVSKLCFSGVTSSGCAI
jgi:hypothetical protein